MKECPGCGSEELATEVCASGPHYAKLRCSACGRFIKFLPRPTTPGGPPPADVLAMVRDRAEPVPLRGSDAQVKFAEACRNSILYRAKRSGNGILHSVALCVTDASWFIANKDKPLAEIHWPSPRQMEAPRSNQESA